MLSFARRCGDRLKRNRPLQLFFARIPRALALVLVLSFIVLFADAVSVVWYGGEAWLWPRHVWVYRPIACVDHSGDWLSLPSSIFVIHHSSLHERRIALQHALRDQKLTRSDPDLESESLDDPVHWITYHRADDPVTSADTNATDLDRLWNDHFFYYSDSARYEMFYRATDPRWRLKDHRDHSIYLPAHRFLSLALKHRVALELIVAKRLQHALIIEDDVSFRNWTDASRLVSPSASLTGGGGSDESGLFRWRLLHEYWNQLPCDYDMFFLGSMWNDHRKSPFYIPVKGSQRVYKRTTTRTTDAYVVSLKGAQKILDVLLPITMAIDWQLNWVISRQHLNVYWAAPPLIDQGSHIGTFKTSL